MDVVIPFAKANGIDLELKFCLRSIQKYLPDLGNVFLIGGLPPWIKNIQHIPLDDIPDIQFKNYNIFAKIMAACNNPEVSENFYCSSDDIFLLRQYAPDYNHKGLLADALPLFQRNQLYRHTLRNSMDALSGGYDIGHGPIVYNKNLFKETVGKARWTMKHGFSCKVLYINQNNIAGKFMEDVKIGTLLDEKTIREKIAGQPYFSITDAGMNEELKQIMHELYPVKSLFEK